MNLLVFAGAGASIELGVPGMLGMGEEFLQHTRQWNVEPRLVERLIGGSLDVEHLIEALDRICSARPTLDVMGQAGVPLDRVESIRTEVEWFVQHAAERVVTSDARLMWGPLLRMATEHELVLVTTNYDRAIEVAANAENVLVDDGFEAFGQREAALWVGFRAGSERTLLVKLHGSTDWYAAGEFGTPTKLRHPMPLFGRASLRLADGTELGSALVLPSREKLLTHSPYPRLSQTFLNAADECEMAVFVGSSLRDHHVRDAAEATARRVPVFVATPTGETFSLDGARPIKQCASMFLIATLPNALASSDPVAALEAISDSAATDDGILPAVRLALDGDSSIEARCKALEYLDERSVTLDSHTLRLILADDSAAVARYSLGLISMARHGSELIAVASASPHLNDPAFREDLDLLREIVRPEVAERSVAWASRAPGDPPASPAAADVEVRQ